MDDFTPHPDKQTAYQAIRDDLLAGALPYGETYAAEDLAWRYGGLDVEAVRGAADRLAEQNFLDWYRPPTQTGPPSYVVHAASNEEIRDTLKTLQDSMSHLVERLYKTSAAPSIEQRAQELTDLKFAANLGDVRGFLDIVATLHVRMANDSGYGGLADQAGRNYLTLFMYGWEKAETAALARNPDRLNILHGALEQMITQGQAGHISALQGLKNWFFAISRG